MNCLLMRLSAAALTSQRERRERTQNWRGTQGTGEIGSAEVSRDSLTGAGLSTSLARRSPKRRLPLLSGSAAERQIEFFDRRVRLLLENEALVDEGQFASIPSHGEPDRR